MSPVERQKLGQARGMLYQVLFVMQETPDEQLPDALARSSFQWKYFGR